MGVVGKNTACRILAYDTQIRQRFHQGIFWIELGRNSTADTFIHQLIHVTELSGGTRTAASISEAGTNGFEQVRSYFQRWFGNRAVLFVVHNVGSSDEPTRKKWVAAIKGVPGSGSVVLHLSRRPLGKTNVEFVPLDKKEQRLSF
jgi:hypothetical protein